MGYRADKLVIDARTDGHTQTDAGNDNTRRPKLASHKHVLMLLANNTSAKYGTQFCGLNKLFKIPWRWINKFTGFPWVCETIPYPNKVSYRVLQMPSSYLFSVYFYVTSYYLSLSKMQLLLQPSQWRKSTECHQTDVVTAISRDTQNQRYFFVSYMKLFWLIVISIPLYNLCSIDGNGLSKSNNVLCTWQYTGLR